MENTIKVSIILPVYNAGERVNACVNNLLTQTIDSYEIIIVNDGSTDESSSILNKIAADNPHKVKLIETPNRGAYCARNTALDNARGEWIYLCDADDITSKDTCRYLYERAVKNNAQISTCALTHINSKGDATKGVDTDCPTNGEEVINRDEIIRRWIMPLFRFSKDDHLKARGYMPVCLFNMEVIKKNNLRFEERLRSQGDELFILKYLNCIEKAALSDKRLYQYIFYDKSICATFFHKRIDIFKVEKKEAVLAENRREVYEKYFTNKNLLARLFIRQILHKIAMILTEENLGAIKKYDMAKSALDNFKKDKVYKETLEIKKNLSRGERYLLAAFTMGAPFTYIMVKAFLISKNVRAKK